MNASPLITRCAHCHTVFRVTAEQLRARAGQVRCGRCLQVFDALAGLQPEPLPATAVEAAQSAPAVPPEPAMPAAVPAPETAIAAQPVAESRAAAAVSAETGLSPAIDPPALEAMRQAAAEPDPPAPEGRTAAPRDIMPVPQSADSGNDGGNDTNNDQYSDNPFITATPAAVPEPRRRIYALASALLLLLLAGQAVYTYRGEIAARHALAGEWMIAACARAGCAVEMPQRPQQVMIEGSDLQLMDPARPERIQLTATLRNHAPHAVGFPALDLVLTNANDHTLARRIFLPPDYLPATVDRSAGLAAQAEMTVRLALDAGDLGASGFRLAVLAAAP